MRYSDFRLRDLPGGVMSDDQTYETQPGRQIAVRSEIIESRNELSMGQIAGGAKDHY